MYFTHYNSIDVLYIIYIKLYLIRLTYYYKVSFFFLFGGGGSGVMLASNVTYKYEHY